MADNGGSSGILTSLKQGVEALNNVAKTLNGVTIAGQGVPTGGTAGQVLSKVSSTNYDTTWTTISGTGTVTSVDASGGTTGLSFSGGPVTTSGTLTLSGALAAANGGVPTGGTTGQALVKNSGTNYDASWTTLGGSGTVTSVDASGGTTGLSFSGGPVTTSGTLTLSGALVAANGGVPTGGTTGQVLSKVSGTNYDVTWSTPSGTGTVTSVAISGGTTGLTTSGGPITTSGTVTFSGTLVVGNGGTGATTLTSFGLLYGNGTSAISATAAMTNGQLLVGQTSSAPLPKTITGDVTFAASGAASLSTNQKTATIGVIIDGGGSTITTGIKGDLSIPFACTIQDWTLLADQSGSIVVDIWKDTYANYPPTVADTITAAAKPTISTSTKGTSSTLTGWTTSIAAGDTLRFSVDSVTTIQRVTLALKVSKT